MIKRRNTIISLFVLTILILSFQTAVLSFSKVSAAEILIEAESFSDPGGWVIDTQCIDADAPGRAGSPLLLAHGMGRPVADASTPVVLPTAGRYYLFVRTRNWASFWMPQNITAEDREQKWSPGKFQVLIDGTPLPKNHGIDGDHWSWQYGGEIDASDTKTLKISLRDLTGFEGRVDALFLTTEKTCRLPNDPAPLAEFRTGGEKAIQTPQLTQLSQSNQTSQTPQLPQELRFDLVVVGGGLAGCSAAATAANAGLNVALIQNRPVLGGNGSAEVGVPYCGDVNLPPYKNLGNLTKKLGSYRNFKRDVRITEDQQRLAFLESFPTLKIFLSTHVVAANVDGKTISSVTGQNTRTGERTIFSARLFADCTGDGTLGYLAGADYRVGREARAEFDESIAPEKEDKLQLGASIQWSSRMASQPSTFPYPLHWAVQFGPENFHPLWESVWYWECGLRFDQIQDVERIRDQAFRSIYGNWAAIKNNSPWAKLTTTPRYELEWVAFNLGKRESRRLMGDYIVTQTDLIENKIQPDGCVATSWHIDLHHPKDALSRPDDKHLPRTVDGKPEEAFLGFLRQGTDIKPYPIPYRCMYSRNINNLFMAGRCISCSHVGFGAIRVMRTCSMMGEVVGMAAGVCVRQNTTPRGVYTDHWPEMKRELENGVVLK